MARSVDLPRAMMASKLPNLALATVVCVTAALTTGCYGKAGPDGFVLATAALTGAVVIAANAHAEHERELAWERERDEAPVYQQTYVGNAAALAPLAPATPPDVPPPAFDANAARIALAGVELEACRAAGAPRGYGHAKATIHPSGDVSKVIIDEPAGMPVAAVQCIGHAIGRVTVPEFTGSSVTVGTTYFVP